MKLFKIFYLFTYYFGGGCIGFLLLHASLLHSSGRSYFLVVIHWLLWLQSTGSRAWASVVAALRL